MSNIPENQASSAPRGDEQKSRSNEKSSRPHKSRSGRYGDRQSEIVLRGGGGASGGGIPVGGGRELNFFDILSILERQIWIIILATVVGTAGAGYLFTTQKKEFSASSNVYVPATNSMSILSGVERGATGNMQQNLRGDKIETHALIFKSSRILAGAWKTILSNQELRNLLKTQSLRELAESENEQKAVQTLSKMVSAKVGGDQRDLKETNTITVSCMSGNPEEAAMIVNTVVDQYQLYFTEKYNRNNDDVRQAIQDSKTSIEEEIKEKKQQLFEYIQNSAITFIGSEDANPLLTSLIKMSENMVEIDFHIMKLENRLESLEASIGGRNTQDISEAELIALMSGGDDDGMLIQLISAARGVWKGA